MASYNFRPDRPNKPHSVQYRGADGGQKRESFRTKSEARAAVSRRSLDEERWRREGPGAREPRDVTVGELADEWFAQYDRQFSTRKRRRSNLDHWIRPQIASKTLKEVTPRDLVQILVNVRDAGRGVGTEGSVYGTTRLLFDYARRMGLISENPADAVATRGGVRARARQPLPLTDFEFEALVNAMRAPYDVMAMLMFYGGMRPGEACALEGRHVDVEGGWVTVEQSVKADRTVGPTKTGQSRILPMAKRLRVALAGADGHLFPHPVDGAWMSERHFREVGWTRAAKRVGLEDRQPYDLRHSAASRLLQRGASIRVVMEFMGHASLKTTERYLHLFPGDMGKLGDLLD